MSTVEIESVSKRFGSAVAVDNISFTVRSGQIVSLLGPSGCGKTTTLRLIAGFESPDAGAIRIAGRDTAGSPPYARNVGLLFQDYALFPHMTVGQNVAFGLRHRDFPKQEIPRRTREMLELVKLGDLARRRPSQLSGGQRQRVALARALATQPEVMLLDEPLSALDAKLRLELRVELKEILETVGTTAIVVTHDQQEAMSLAEHVIVMHQGRIVQQGSPSEIYRRPRSMVVAEFIGQSNWFEGHIDTVDEEGIQRLTTDDNMELKVRGSGHIAETDCNMCIRPEQIDMTVGPMCEPAQTDHNVLAATIIDVSYLGAEMQFVLELVNGQRVAVTQTNRNQRSVRRREVVTISFAAEDCIVFPRESTSD